MRNRRAVFADLQLGRSVVDQFLRIAEQDQFEVVAYCVMPDHLHALLEGLSDQADLHRLMHRWKLLTGHWWRHQVEPTTLWQGGYYDHVLRPRDPEAAVVRYIIANPVRAGIVDSVLDYPLTGSSRYDLRALAEASMDWTPSWK